MGSTLSNEIRRSELRPSFVSFVEACSSARRTLDRVLVVAVHTGALALLLLDALDISFISVDTDKWRRGPFLGQRFPSPPLPLVALACFSLPPSPQSCILVSAPFAPCSDNDDCFKSLPVPRLRPTLPSDHRMRTRVPRALDISIAGASHTR